MSQDKTTAEALEKIADYVELLENTAAPAYPINEKLANLLLSHGAKRDHVATLTHVAPELQDLLSKYAFQRSNRLGGAAVPANPVESDADADARFLRYLRRED